jgi:hypothetical protein
VVRLQNAAAAPVTASVRLALPVTAAWRSDLLEGRGRPLEIVDGRVQVPLEPRGQATVLLEVRAAPPAPEAPSLDPTVGQVLAADPSLPDAAATLLGVLPLPPTSGGGDGPRAIPVRLLNRHHELFADVTLSCPGPPGLALDLQPTNLRLAPGEESAATLLLPEAARAIPGLSRLTLRAEGRWTAASAEDQGEALRQRLAAAIPIGSVQAPPPVRLETETPLVASHGLLTVTLLAAEGAPLSGVLRWIAPPACWPGLAAPARPVELPAGASRRLDVPVGEVRDGWAVPCFVGPAGVVLGESAALCAQPARRVVSVDVPALELRRERPTSLTVTVRSLEALTADERLDVLPVEGLRVREGERRLFREAGGGLRLEIDVSLRAPSAPARGTLQLVVGRGSLACSALLPYRVREP